MSFGSSVIGLSAFVTLGIEIIITIGIFVAELAVHHSTAVFMDMWITLPAALDTIKITNDVFISVDRNRLWFVGHLEKYSFILRSRLSRNCCRLIEYARPRQKPAISPVTKKIKHWIWWTVIM
jgi:hypothetical protein